MYLILHDRVLSIHAYGIITREPLTESQNLIIIRNIFTIHILKKCLIPHPVSGFSLNTFALHLTSPLGPLRNFHRGTCHQTNKRIIWDLQIILGPSTDHPIYPISDTSTAHGKFIHHPPPDPTIAYICGTTCRSPYYPLRDLACARRLKMSVDPKRGFTMN